MQTYFHLLKPCSRTQILFFRCGGTIQKLRGYMPLSTSTRAWVFPFALKRLRMGRHNVAVVLHAPMTPTTVVEKKVMMSVNEGRKAV